MRLPSGLAWSVPVTLAVAARRAGRTSARPTRSSWSTRTGRFLGVLEVTDRYETDPVREARLVYGTEEDAHPGVASLYAHGTTCLAGPVRVARAAAARPGRRAVPARPAPLARASSTPAAGRASSGFQTRNPIHRAHEYITKVALETVDGLFLHPLVGETKSDDIPADVRMRCYEVLIEGYYPPERVVLGVLPAAMRYAGPREAVLHAILRQNYGCTHFIVGRDHAGVGNYYGTYDAHRIFDDITPRRARRSSRCSSSTPSGATSPAGWPPPRRRPRRPEERVFLSGTKVREMLDRGEIPPVEFTRPEVAEILIEAYAKASA